MLQGSKISLVFREKCFIGWSKSKKNVKKILFDSNFENTEEVKFLHILIRLKVAGSDITLESFDAPS